MKKAIDLALAEAEADGSMPANFSMVWGDSATDPATGREEVRRLAGQGAKLIVTGTTSGTAKAFLPELEDSDVIALSPSASAPSLTKDSKRFFRLFASDELEGQRAGRFLLEGQDKNTVLIFSQDSEQARGIEPFFRQVYEGAMGGTVVGRVLIGDDNWHDECSDLIAARQPESVYIIAYANKTLEVLRHLKEKGYTGTICATSAFYSGEVLEQEPELVDGVFFPMPAFEIQSELEVSRTFVDSFRAEYGHDPDIYAAHAYDAMRVALTIPGIVRAWEANEIRRALQFEIKEFPGRHGTDSVRRLRRCSTQPGDLHRQGRRGPQLHQLSRDRETEDPREDQDCCSRGRAAGAANYEFSIMNFEFHRTGTWLSAPEHVRCHS